MNEPRHVVIRGGRGWGDKVIAFNERRKHLAENTYTGFRPRVENEASYYIIRNWCADERIKLSFSALINSILPGLKVACENTTEVDACGRVSIELNLGRIIIQ